ncbi:hypothetical protein [Clostridium sp.]|uniref:hypothetical protein n=1 Tax=Clostridium sp. TaxID=1506 RepID=UPI00290B82EC|nr:hypothetical protein [Clostridium sp.]MDU3410034.1 hypothetical protein [Clostridium sp.]
MGEVNEFLKKLNNEDMVSLGLLEEDMEIYTLKQVKREIKRIGVNEIVDTYWEQLIFESKDGGLYELALM